MSLEHLFCQKVTMCSNNDGDMGFPGGAVVENLPANAGDTGSSPGLGRSHIHGASGPVSHNY